MKEKIKAFKKTLYNYFRIEYLLLLIIMGFALFVRLTGISKGLPYLHHYDEPFVASRALIMLKTGDFNPHFFSYGGLSIYFAFVVDIFHYLFLIGKDLSQNNYLTGLSAIQVDQPHDIVKGKYIWTISHPSFYLWNRGLIAIMGSLMVYIIYLITRNITRSRIAALTSAAILAVSSTMILHSRFITPNMPGALAVLISIYYAIKFNSTKQKLHLLYSLVFCGCAIATKFNYGVCLSIPLLIYWINSGKFQVNRIQGTILCGLITFGVFFLFNPYILVDFTTFLTNVGNQLKHYKTGHGSHTIEPGFTHLLFQINKFQSDLGLFLIICSFFGLLLSFKTKNGWIPTVFGILYMAYMVRQRVDFHRNFIVFYPFIALWAVIALGYMSFLISGLINRVSIKSIGLKKMSLLKYTPYLIVLVLVSFKGVKETRKANALANSVETRTQAIYVINEIVDKSSARIAIAKELRVHKQDLRKLNANYEIINHKNFKEEAFNYDYFITGKFGSVRAKLRKKDSLYNAMFADKTRIKVIKGKTINLRRFHRNPTIYIYRGDDPRPEKISAASFKGWYNNTKSTSSNRSEYIGASGGTYTTRKIKFKAGMYQIRIQIRGNSIQDETARLKFLIGKNELVTLNTRPTYEKTTINFEIKEEKSVPIQIIYLNDYFNSESKEDRNFFLKEFEITKVDSI